MNRLEETKMIFVSESENVRRQSMRYSIAEDYNKARRIFRKEKHGCSATSFCSSELQFVLHTYMQTKMAALASINRSSVKVQNFIR